MDTLGDYLDDQLALGRMTFTRSEALHALELSDATFNAAVARQTLKQRLACPRRGFYLILRPEDRTTGAPDPVRWIDALMRFQQTDYRVSLLRAAAFHGASHQAAMVFQVVAPRQFRNIELGRQRVCFIFQSPPAFAELNRKEYLADMKTDSGFVKTAGVELTLFDAMRYPHQAGGLHNVAQIVKDLGNKAKPRKLAHAAPHFENVVTRRLGFLLELFGHLRQASVLEPFATRAKSVKPLDVTLPPLSTSLLGVSEENRKWKLVVHEPVEVDF